MRTFEHFNKSGDPCPICKTHDDKPPVLVQISGTGDGNIAQAMQVHLECIELIAYKQDGQTILTMILED